MITFKQMEALYWIAECGSFEAAALRLNMSQSAISKRIQELEDTFETPLFDRSRRSARLTEKGVELLEHVRELLARRDQLLERVGARDVQLRRLRLGVTELTALTWLPAFVEAIRQAYPRLQIEPSVELSSELYRKLEGDELDLIVVPDVFQDARFVCTPLQSVENAWMCGPELSHFDGEVALADLAQYTVMTQGSSSGTGLVYERWLAEQGVHLPRMITSQNLLVQVGLTISGIGISYLPRQCLSQLVERGALQVIRTRPRLPQVRYGALYRTDRSQGINPAVAELAGQTCDFSRLLLGVF
ncbi:LysR family transcriptional regulator [Pantoea sp. Ap-967]|uniref:LysR family transcriptional regulator n=1 Tax=Pantoea sp. Ap-967 TaxID=2608362 RepID=UPI001422DBDC|nr:LysR family transcriptional regulator [Pantoea sp. Ap-967]NIE73385.1 LysR family transcriptional regulator [Pantoea sp. Ap-967]